MKKKGDLNGRLFFFIRATWQTRTADLRVTNALLYRLS